VAAPAKKEQAKDISYNKTRQGNKQPCQISLRGKIPESPHQPHANPMSAAYCT
jgi:hypothetical protein